MSASKRWVLAGATGLALVCAPAMAQSGEEPMPQPPASDQQPESNETPVKPPVGTPTPQNPAETETPEAPAASGGAASDATRSGGPAGSATQSDETGSDTTEEPTPNDNGGAENRGADHSRTSLDNPRNAVGDKFELPRVGKGDQKALLAGLCGIQMKAMSEAACGCLADQALKALSDPQRDYLIASAVAPPVADRMIGDGRVGQPDQQIIFSFLNQTSDACVTGTYKPTAANAPEASEPSKGSDDTAPETEPSTPNR